MTKPTTTQHDIHGDDGGDRPDPSRPAIAAGPFGCADVQAVLSGLLDDEVDAATRHLAESHLAGCSRCRATLQKAEELDLLTRATFAAHERRWSPSLEHRIEAAIFNPFETRAVAALSRRRLLAAAWSGWGMAVAAAVAAGFLFLYRTPSGPSTENAVNTLASDEEGGSIAPETPNGGLALSTTPRGPRPVIVDEVILPEELQFIDEARDASHPAWSNAIAGAFERETDYTAALAAAALRRSYDRRIEDILGPISAADLTAESDEAVAADEESPSRAAFDLDDAIALSTEASPVTGEIDDALALESQRTANVLHQASILLHVLEDPSRTTDEDVALVREAVEDDDVLHQLAQVRTRLDTPESVSLVNQAWTVLELASGQVDPERLEHAQETIARQGLPGRLEQLSDRYGK